MKYEMPSEGSKNDFAKIPPTATTLDFRAYPQGDILSQLVAHSPSLQGLESLLFWYFPENGDMDFLRNFPKLKHLSIQNFLSATDVSGIRHCTHLESLNLGHTKLAKGSLLFLDHLSNLRSLTMEGPYPFRDIDKILPLDKLETLGLYASRMDEKHLGAKFPNLQNLRISQGPLGSLDFLDAMPKLRVLKVFYARRLNNFSGIGRHRELKELNLESAISALVSTEQFGVSKSIEKLALEAGNLKDVKTLLDWPSLKKLGINKGQKIPAEQFELLRSRFPNSECNPKKCYFWTKNKDAPCEKHS